MYVTLRTTLLGGAFLLASTSFLLTSSEEISSGFETVHTSNAAILNRLGLAPLQIPDGHHKKRLAGPEPPGLSGQTRIHQPYSRRHGHRDSHVYIVKLPASPPYYTITKPHKSSKDDKGTKAAPSLPVGFHGNGKPAKIYHWNLPVVKKITEKKRIQAQMRMDQARKKLEEAKKEENGSPDTSLKNVLTKAHLTDAKSHSVQDGKRFYGDGKQPAQQKVLPAKHTRNNDKRLNYPEKIESPKKGGGSGQHQSNKTYRLEDSSVHRIRLTNELHGSRNSLPKMKKHRKKAAMSYYAPISTKSGSTSIHKNFPGNGKPKAFYVMEKSRKPVYYHPLLP